MERKIKSISFRSKNGDMLIQDAITATQKTPYMRDLQWENFFYFTGVGGIDNRCALNVKLRNIRLSDIPQDCYLAWGISLRKKANTDGRRERVHIWGGNGTPFGDGYPTGLLPIDNTVAGGREKTFILGGKRVYRVATYHHASLIVRASHDEGGFQYVDTFHGGSFYFRTAIKLITLPRSDLDFPSLCYLRKGYKNPDPKNGSGDPALWQTLTPFGLYLITDVKTDSKTSTLSYYKVLKGWEFWAQCGIDSDYDIRLGNYKTFSIWKENMEVDAGAYGGSNRDYFKNRFTCLSHGGRKT
ncbi:MAG: hypothetical protein LBG17_04750 [Bacteroidales bacterium]|jgi:hypothetical protein|nr:hypothetical protein [Bacteroidales bacterium]